MGEVNNEDPIKERLEAARRLGYTACVINYSIQGILSKKIMRPKTIFKVPKEILIYKRITLIAGDIICLYKNLRNLEKVSWSLKGYRGYELVAVLPLNNIMFSKSCRTLGVHIISLNLTKQNTVKFKPLDMRKAIRRGIVFEISFASALRSNIARKNIFANATMIFHATAGRGIVLTSGALSVFDMRGPYEVINIGVVLGLSR